MDSPVLDDHVTLPASETPVEVFREPTQPIRGTPFSLEHLEEHARALSAQHEIVDQHPAQRQLWKQFERNAEQLESVYEALHAALAEDREIAPGSEWLLDNFYVVRDQLREIRDDLPPKFYRELPKLKTGTLAGMPRVYALALEIIAHTDSALDSSALVHFIKAYQESTPLTMGEIWAVPIALRLGLVENLRRLADRIVEAQLHRGCADTWANEILDERPSDPHTVLAERTRQHKTLAPPLVARMVERFRDQGHELHACWQWLVQRLAGEGKSVDELVRMENQRQAADQVSTGNAITSMRWLSAMDWSWFFEETSLVEQELRHDPGDVYRHMDFATRDRYRHVVERLSRRAKRPELDVAQRVVQQARRVDGDRVQGHVGYYLIDDGRVAFEQHLGLSQGGLRRLLNWFACRREQLYVGGLLLVWGLCLTGLLSYTASAGATAGMLVLAGLVWAIPLSEFCVTALNYFITLVARPRLLPKMDYRGGLPTDCTTVVVVPALLANKENVHKLIERLEIHYLANPDPHLTYALLVDFPDAPEQTMPDDAPLLAAAEAGIAELNERHCPGADCRFWLFHRTRLWNPVEGKWMGWERKRGKLSEFNRLLRGAADTSYAQVPDLPNELTQAQYVITLDADTQFPLGAGRGLVSTLAHPLNHPRLSASGAVVQHGYAVLQPRVSLNPVTAKRTWFARVYSGNPHVDPYVTAVSDAYQDAFAEGIYTGKGIYHIDAFEATVGDTFPSNRILSHDLIEGCHARAALVTDIELIDDYPAQYHAYARRQHRWVRGDWQLLPWLLWWVPLPQGRRRNPLNVISRWKILDNLRRSLVPPTLLAALVVGWLVLPGPIGLWSCLAGAVLALPLIMQLISTLRGWPRGTSWWGYLRGAAPPLAIGAAQALLALTFLPHQAYLMLDAILRTLVRLTVTRRHLLEWETAYATEQRLRSGLVFFLREMWPAPLFALAVGAALAAWQAPPVFWATLPVVALWFGSPALAYVLSRPVRQEPFPLNDDERRELREVAYRTWLFFRRFVTADDHWLPPDNFQEDPKGVIAHRTSPTNEGLFLLSTLAAHDFGYVGFHELATWIERNLDTWTKLDHYRGHPYNWYDTQSLTSLQPDYISTVDSGNLAACALTLRQGLIEVTHGPLLGVRLVAGLSDAFRVLTETERSIDALHQQKSRRRAVDDQKQLLRAFEHTISASPRAWYRSWQRLEANVQRLIVEAESHGLDRDLRPNVWDFRARVLVEQLQETRGDVEAFFPWLVTSSSNGHAAVNGDHAPHRHDDHLPQPPGLDDLPAERREAWRQAWSTLEQTLDAPLSLAEVELLPETLEPTLAALRKALGESFYEVKRQPARRWLETFAAQLERGAEAARQLIERYERLGERLRDLALGMDFTFLFDHERKLFSIGYNLTNAQLDRSRYDLLASEARLASFFAIGKGDVDHRHWFHLGRPITHVAGENTLLSWGGTMFEFLMPNIFLRSYPETLLYQSCLGAIDRQIEFGRQNRLPWGVSESAFAAFDNAMNYQYRSFGVPGLGLKRGLSDDLVVAPYATGLALMFRPREGLENLRALEREGARGQWGFVEAIDYTPVRVPVVQEKYVLGCYFAHHQGMLLNALANCLLDNGMQRRFHKEPRTRAVERLLMERVPLFPSLITPHREERAPVPVVRQTEAGTSRWISTPHTTSPRAHLLSNGKYTVMVTNTGSGFSQWEKVRLTRWRADTTCDAWGQYIYVRDRRRGTLWSATYQPTRRPADEYEVLFSVDKAEFRRLDGDLETHCEVAVTPDTNAEVRLLTITNHGQRTRTLDVTSYAEIVLGEAGADLAHPAFQKLFIETEFLPERQALLARRRPRQQGEAPQWAVHVLAIDETQRYFPAEPVQYETDREQFLGRGGSTSYPQACAPGETLSGTVGPVLDPIFSLRRTLRVPPDQSVRLAFSTAYAATREEALALADQFHDLRVVVRAFELAWAHAQVALRHVHLTSGHLHQFQRLASLLLYPDASKRAAPSTLAANRQGVPGLWRYGVSGDYPILLVRIDRGEQEALVRDILLAHEHWRSEQFVVEVVILNEHPASYMDAVQEQLNRLVGETSSWDRLNRRGGIFILQASHLPEEDRTLLLAAAQVVLSGGDGPLERQLEPAPQSRSLPEPLPVRYEPPSRDHGKKPRKPGTRSGKGLQFAQSLGGFAADGREYVIHVGPDQQTPQPWSNVIANARFGCLVTESGSGYTWSENSRENRLTGWSNDPVCDPPSEAVYLRDEETGEFWSPTPLPVPAGEYTVRHRQGSTVFEHTSHELTQELTISVAADDPVKLVRLKVRNDSSETRQLSATFCAEWVLGVDRHQTQLHVVTDVDPETGALLASNAFNHEFSQRVAFVHVVGPTATVTGDRTEFLGRNRDWSDPAAMARRELSGAVGPGFDPFGAVQAKFWLKAGHETELLFVLGQADHRQAAQELLARYARPAQVTRALEQATTVWNDMLETIQVQTPSPALDLLVNRWLLYQVLSCRFWGRTAFYQSSGAYGFRDQLQDAMALVYSRPDLARQHLLYAASRQFEEGDVQHWWHPPTGRGVRTRFSDDLLWLPLVTAHYLQVTGDLDVLRESVPYLHAAELQEHEEERYEQPAVSSISGTLYDHCVRAIERGSRFGEHDLPLMGTGDWNDGMNRVGSGGRGESVWVGWFLASILEQFAPYAERMQEPERVDNYRLLAEKLRRAVELAGWDGAWYRRAYFDDGTPLGSIENDACQLDSLTQSWAVIAGGDRQRAQQGMEAVWERLVRPGEQLVRLFWPPFDQTPLEPGYVKGYLPGIRENGGQYTHAAMWVVQAWAMLGQGNRAMQLYEMLLPTNHAADDDGVALYQVEPYAVAADIYSTEPHLGRGGWTWYTGSAAWMYRVAVEYLLGLQVRGDTLSVRPCIPAEWPGFTMTYRHRRATYRITVENPQHVEGGVRTVTLNGEQVSGTDVPLATTGDHEVCVLLG